MTIIFTIMYISSIVGALVGLLIPAEQMLDIYSIITELAKSVQNIGQYMLYIMLFCHTIIGVNELRNELKLVKVYFSLSIWIIVMSVISIISGIIFGILLSTKPISILPYESSLIEKRSFIAIIQELIPANIVEIFLIPSFALPVICAAILFGIAMYKHNNTRVHDTTFHLIESLANISQQVNEYLHILVSLCMGILSCFMVLHIRQENFDFSIFSQILFIIFLLGFIIIFIIIPLCMHMLHYCSYIEYIKKSIPFIVASFFIQNNTMMMARVLVWQQQLWKIPTNIAHVITGFLFTFNCSGTLFVGSIGFITIIHSYSRIQLSISELGALSIQLFILLFLLLLYRERIVMVLLMLLCTWYGKGIETGYLLFSPIIILLSGMAFSIDTALNLAIAYRIAKKNDLIKKVHYY